MGKIYKNTDHPKVSTSPIFIKNTISPFQETTIINTSFVLPQAKIIPLENFNQFLDIAIKLIHNNEFDKALSFLVNLEITDPNNIQVHELLADVFLQLNQLALAKEQCQICAELLSKINPSDIFTLKTFEQILADAGNFNELEQDFKSFQTEEITNDNFHYGTNIALKLATHHMSQQRYQEAEALLINFRDKYTNFLENTES